MIEYFRKQLCIKWYNFIVHNRWELPYNIKYMAFPEKVIILLGVFYFSISVLTLLNGRVGNRSDVKRMKNIVENERDIVSYFSVNKSWNIDIN